MGNTGDAFMETHKWGRVVMERPTAEIQKMLDLLKESANKALSAEDILSFYPIAIITTGTSNDQQGVLQIREGAAQEAQEQLTEWKALAQRAHDALCTLHEFVTQS